jgi:hypothetical protein
MEANSSVSRQNNKKYSEKNAIEAYWLNLYPMANHGNYKSQSQVWPFWRPYFHNPCFTVCTIPSTNPSTSRWYHEIVRWSINGFSHKSLKSLQNSRPWSMKTLARTPNLLNILSKNAYVDPSMLRFGKGTNSNHLEKCSVITKT